MKKEKQESLDKAAKKKTRDDIQSRLVKVIKAITVELGQDALDIEKEAKKLAKKITKHLKAKTADKVNSPAGVTKNTVAKAVTPKENTVSKAPLPVVKKPVAKATPSKTVTPKAAAPKTQTVKAVAPKKA
jgi:hypothetical protein